MATDSSDLEQNEGRRGLAPAQAALVVVGALVLLLLVWFLFLRGGDDDLAEDTAVAPAPVASPQETPVDSPDKSSPVETFEVFAPKDPFDPLISAATGGGGAATADGGATTATADGSGATTITTDDGTGTTTTTTTTTTGDGGGGEDVGGHRVRVIDVFVENGDARAQIQVDGTVYTVDRGERFADNFQLLSTSGQCATMLFGDDEFTLCEGEEILK